MQTQVVASAGAADSDSRQLAARANSAEHAADEARQLLSLRQSHLLATFLTAVFMVHDVLQNVL
jgi:hypothetical protein